jgi:DNA-binding PadR family transcriptional regulator
MPKKSLESLTESMFYVLMALNNNPKCGTEIADFIERRGGKDKKPGPATLYTILSKFESEKYIKEIDVDGRKRTYKITEKGEKAYYMEIERLKKCLEDAEKEEI